MAARAFTSVTARVAIVVAATTLVAAAASTTDASELVEGETCKCAKVATADKCIVFTSFSNDAMTEGTCKMVGYECDAPWECTDDRPTHMCVAHAGEATPKCTKSLSDDHCECRLTGNLVLGPTHMLSAEDGRRGGVERQLEPAMGEEEKKKPVTDMPVSEQWSPEGPAPAPKSPACKATHAIVSVEGTPWRCVASTDIGHRSAEEAYHYHDGRNNGWATKDDYINLNLMRDAASRLYLCITYGSTDRSDEPEAGRSALASLVSAAPNRFYFQDDPMSVDANGKRTGDLYSPKDRSFARALAAKHNWGDTSTDGYCVDAAAGLTADFMGLTYVKGLALSEGGAAGGFPNTGPWAFWKLRTAPTTGALAYDGAGRILPAVEQERAWVGRAGVRPPSAIHRVTVAAACSCDGWRAGPEAPADDGE
eukprot:TRINITY_DN13897_c0_g1_i1.p1 TRINITY_DN13897_c0_g1~~TRINITY_DN13897_c0_g1_i1.p1  ORF type:complete len:423 (+),score=122.82 TRINITY_DN13897_c0_g1_i1:804-2072(+)